VLAARPLRPGVDPTGLSVVADQRWLLSPAIFEDHLQTRTLNYALQPQRFWASAKRYVWLLLNHAEPPRPPGSTGRRPSVASIGKGFDDLAAVTAADLDAYLRDLLASQLPPAVMADRVIEVRRLWAWRGVLPACDRLPQAPPWNGDNANTVVGHHPHGVENRTPRIHPDTMDRLLGWALRFVDVFADDILAAAHEHRRLHQHSLRRRRRDVGPTRGAAASWKVNSAPCSSGFASPASRCPASSVPMAAAWSPGSTWGACLAASATGSSSGSASWSRPPACRSPTPATWTRRSPAAWTASRGAASVSPTTRPNTSPSTCPPPAMS
jgi:hypothetical protein